MKYIVTGATGAIGKEIARGIAAKGDTPILACRNRRKADMLADEIRQDYGIDAPIMIVDLADADSVREAAAGFEGTCIAGIVNNAGVMNATLKLDADGHEDTVNVNYRNTRLLSELLIPHIEPGGCIVFTTSATRKWFPGQSLDKESAGPFGRYNRMWVYARSKKLVTRYARELEKPLSERGIRVNCADPGVVDSPMLTMHSWYDRLTDLLFRPLCLSPRAGASAALRALYSPHSGRIFSAPFGTSLNKRWLDA